MVMLVYIGKITLTFMSVEWTASVYVTSKMFKLGKVVPCFEGLNQEVREIIVILFLNCTFFFFKVNCS